MEVVSGCLQEQLSYILHNKILHISGDDSFEDISILSSHLSYQPQLKTKLTLLNGL